MELVEAVQVASVRFRPMGVLDDAIREHLQLKRKHGAAEEELQRQEEEALGPVRREVAQPLPAGDQGEEPQEAAAEPAPADAEEAAPDELSDEELYAPQPAATEPEPETSVLDEPGVLEPFAEEAAPAVPHGPEPADPLPAAEEHAAPLEPWLEERDVESPPHIEQRPDDPELHPLSETREAPAGGDTPARGFLPAEDEPGADEAAHREDEAVTGEREGVDEEPAEESDRGGDVPEDTPDFVQETPEHDRLWFGQKSPRDFDFDFD